VVGYGTSALRPDAAAARLHDTRSSMPVGNGGVVRVTLPAGQAHAVTVTATRAAAAGFLIAWDCAGPEPVTSVVNYGRELDAATLTFVTGSELCVRASSRTDVVVDHFAAFAGFTASPGRIADTRLTAGPLRAGDTLTLRRPIGVRSALLTVTGTVTSADGFVTLHPCGVPVGTSTLNVRVGQDVANAAVADVTRPLCATVGGGVSHLVVDLVGTAG
jgi:hypothetical protein